MLWLSTISLAVSMMIIDEGKGYGRRTSTGEGGGIRVVFHDSRKSCCFMEEQKQQQPEQERGTCGLTSSVISSSDIDK